MKTKRKNQIVRKSLSDLYNQLKDLNLRLGIEKLKIRYGSLNLTEYKRLSEEKNLVIKEICKKGVN